MKALNQNKKFLVPDKKWLVILIIILVVIMVAAAIFFLVYKKDKSEVVPDQMEVEEEQEELLVRYGKMSLIADKTDLSVGENFKVDILMDTEQSNIVAGAAVILYDPLILELVKIDEEDSVFSMSVPGSSEDGRVEIVRAEPGDADWEDNDDGYNGEKGILASLEFKVLKSGAPELDFEKYNSMMILDDARGTEMILEQEGLDLIIQ